jgi:hypothetical protein
MLFALITLLSAISLSAIAAYYSVIGLMAIFAAAPIPIAIMGGALEFSKLIAASWAYKNWSIAPRFLKYYFTIAVIILMLITSLGIFGYLSKAHNDQNLVSGDVSAKIAMIDEKIKVEKDNIDVNRKTLKQMDEAVDQVMVRSTNEKGAEKAASLRKAQQTERSRILKEIETYNKRISTLNEERAPIATEIRKVEAEVGPIKYIAALIYGDSIDSNLLDKSVRFVIILLVLVFDPMAVLLVIAGNFSLRQIAKEKEKKSGGYEVNFSSATNIETPTEVVKRKRKTRITEDGVDTSNNATVFEPIPMSKEELEDAKRKYARDGRSKFADFAES